MRILAIDDTKTLLSLLRARPERVERLGHS